MLEDSGRRGWHCAHPGTFGDLIKATDDCMRHPVTGRRTSPALHAMLKKVKTLHADRKGQARVLEGSGPEAIPRFRGGQTQA